LTDAGAVLRDLIAIEGPIPFARFMEIALYHPEHGYYRGSRDPFGAAGDFFTAAQLQPVFGALVARAIESLFEAMGRPPDFTVVDLGAGRSEMAPAFSGWRYVAVDAARGALPERFRGVVFANEFFDALPVEVVVRRGDQFRRMLVACDGERFLWQEGACVSGDLQSCLDLYGAPLEDGNVLEVGLEARRWLERLAARLERGYLLAIDYGYTGREILRFPAGTLMSYRRHTALDDVLADPGLRDITAHVNFTALEAHARTLGFERVRFESLGQFLLRAGERDQFAAALAADTEAGATRRRLQLKTLLFGMGDVFRVLLLKR